MTTETIDFAGDTSTTAPAQSSGGSDFTIAVGDRVYKSPDDVVKKISHADQHIETLLREKRELEARTKQLEEEAAKAKKLEEILERLQTAPQDNNSGKTLPDVDTLVKQVTEQVENKFLRDRQADQQRANWNEVTTTLTRVFGKDKVNAAVKAVADDAGMSLEEIAILAKEKPKAFLKMFPEVNGSRPTSTNSGSSVRVAPSSNSNAKPHTQLATARTEKERVHAWRDYFAAVTKSN